MPKNVLNIIDNSDIPVAIPALTFDGVKRICHI